MTIKIIKKRIVCVLFWEYCYSRYSRIKLQCV